MLVTQMLTELTSIALMPTNPKAPKVLKWPFYIVFSVLHYTACGISIEPPVIIIIIIIFCCNVLRDALFSLFFVDRNNNPGQSSFFHSG